MLKLYLRLLRKKKLMKKIKVVCGALVQDGKVLIAQRATGDSIGKFEFPGGKVELNETYEEALIREFKEELDIDLTSVSFLEKSMDHQENKEIELYCFICFSNQKPEKCIVHSKFVWTTPEHIYDYDFFESDRNLVQKLIEVWPCIQKQTK